MSYRGSQENYNFETIKHKTVSFGVTILKKGDTVDSILKRADKALYESKKSGRNKLSVNI